MYAGSLNKAFVNGDLQNNMLDIDAFSQVTAVKLVDKLNIKGADAHADTPTQLVGKCQISGLHLSDFLEPQRDAFKSAMATTSGAAKDQVFIRNVFALSARRRLRGNSGQPTSADIVVEFSIAVERDSDTEPASKEDQRLSAGVIVAVVISAMATVFMAAFVVVFTSRKLRAKHLRIGLINKQIPMQNTKHSSNDKSIELSCTMTCSDSNIVRKLSNLSVIGTQSPLVSEIGKQSPLL